MEATGSLGTQSQQPQYPVGDPGHPFCMRGNHTGYGDQTWDHGRTFWQSVTPVGEDKDMETMFLTLTMYWTVVPF